MLAIQEARIRAGLSRRELAERMGVTYHAVGLWEHGVGPAANRIRKLAGVLGCTVDDLLPPEKGSA